MKKIALLIGICLAVCGCRSKSNTEAEAALDEIRADKTETAQDEAVSVQDEVPASQGDFKRNNG